MSRAFTILISAIVWAGGTLSAQALNGPVEAFAFDAPTSSIRPVIGAPGSAYLGTPLIRFVGFASVAPQLGYAVAAQENKLILVTGLAAGQVVETPLARELPGLEAIAWSGDGSTAILFSRTENWVRILSGLPASPNLGSRIDISPSGSISSAAVDATGQTLAIAVTGTHSGVYQLANGGALVPMLPLANPQALAFSSDGTQLYALDQATHQLSQITISGLSTLTWPLAGMTNPVAIGSGRDAQNRSVVYVAGGVDQLLYVYDPATQTLLTSVSLPFQPSSLEVLGRGSFVLAARSANDDPLWSFATAPRLQVSFIPASPLPSGKPQPRGSLVP